MRPVSLYPNEALCLHHPLGESVMPSYITERTVRNEVEQLKLDWYDCWTNYRSAEQEQIERQLAELNDELEAAA